MRASPFTKILAFLVLFSGATLCAEAQDVKFGKISNEELTMRTYEKDTSAAAVVLSDIGNTYFTYGDKGFEFVFERHTRIKILKKAGYEWANFVLPYYHAASTKEKLGGIKGFTYNLEGGKITKDKLSSSGIFDEKKNDYWHQKKVTMPNVKEGSVIELSYEVRSGLLYNLRDWEFQTTIPVIYSEYKARVPEYFEYKLNQQGYLNFAEAKQEKGRETFVLRYGGTTTGRGERTPGGTNNIEVENLTYFFTVKDAPALKAERYITTLGDYQTKISFELQRTKFPGSPYEVMTGNWENVTKSLLDDDSFGRQLKKKSPFKDHLAAINAKYTAPAQKMEAIHALVKGAITWNGYSGIYARDSFAKVFESKKGNVAEINLLLTATLLEAGLDAAPVLLSTRDHGRINTAYSPMLSKFNYVVTHVKIGDKEYLLDATDPLLPATMLPVRCLNGEGRLIRADDQRWISLNPTQLFSKFVSTEVNINEQGNITGKGMESAAGYNALTLRRAIKEEGEEKFAEKRAKEIGDIKVSKPVIGNINEINAALSLTYDINIAGNDQSNDIIYLNPLLGNGEKENPFKLAERMYPVDFAAPVDETYITKFTIPAGYIIEEMPKGVAITLPDNSGRFTYMLQQEGNQLQVMSKLSISKPVFYAQEYIYLKEFYNHIVAKHAEQIVLKKVAGK